MWEKRPVSSPLTGIMSQEILTNDFRFSFFLLKMMPKVSQCQCGLCEKKSS